MLNKYYKPWREHNPTTYIRSVFGYDVSDYFNGLIQVFYIDFPNEKGWLYHIKGKCFATKEEVMSEVDKILLNKGCKFLTEEQYNKLKVLL